MEELWVCNTVRARARQRMPGDALGANEAVAAALRALAGGASPSEACDEGYAFIGSWSRHPSHSVACGVRRLLAAS